MVMSTATQTHSPMRDGVEGYCLPGFWLAAMAPAPSAPTADPEVVAVVVVAEHADDIDSPCRPLLTLPLLSLSVLQV